MNETSMDFNEAYSAPEGLPTLSAGAHKKGSGEACIMEYVSLLSGDEWTDTPSCTNYIMARAAQKVNDDLPDSRRHLLIPMIGRLFGSSESSIEISVALSSYASRAVSEHKDSAKAFFEKISNPTATRLGEKHISNADVYADRAAGYFESASKHSINFWAERHVEDFAVMAVQYSLRAVFLYAYAEHITHINGFVEADLATIKFLTGLIDEYDRVTGRTEHHQVTDQEMSFLVNSVNV